MEALSTALSLLAGSECARLYTEILSLRFRPRGEFSALLKAKTANIARFGGPARI